MGRLNPEVAELAEELRHAVSLFVRTVRRDTGTPRTAKSDTLELLERGESLNVARLAELRNVKHQSMRLIVEQLESDGLVRRVADPLDGRSQLVSITRSGRLWLKGSRKARTQHIGEMIERRLSAKDRSALHTAARLLTQLVAERQEPTN